MSDEKIGATGNYPDGKLNEHDEGELAIRISHDDRLITIEFGKPVSWFAFKPEQAIEFAEMIIEHANDVRNEKNAH